MLEILIVLVLAGRIGRLVEAKGHPGRKYKVLVAAGWFGGEVAGMLLGLLVTDGEGGMTAYGLALIGAILGAALVWRSARRLPEMPEEALGFVAASGGPEAAAIALRQQSAVGVQRLVNAKALLDDGLISGPEYETLRARALDEI